MFKGMTLNVKLISLFMLVGILPLVLIGAISYKNSSSALQEQAFNQLTSVREMKKAEIESYFSTINNQVHTLSESLMIIDAMKDFTKGFKNIQRDTGTTKSRAAKYRNTLKSYYSNDYYSEFKKNNVENISADSLIPSETASIILQHNYIADNPNPLGGKDGLIAAEDASSYSKYHAKYHPTIRDYLKKFGFYDIFLVEPETGYVVYSVYKEVDFATSLRNGPYSSTNFANVFKEAANAGSVDPVFLTDFEEYVPSYNAPASFISSPIFDGNDLIGVLVFQMPVDKINNVMTSNHRWKDVGLGDSGETYLVAEDMTLRSNSRFLIDDKEGYLEALSNTSIRKDVLDHIAKTDNSIGLQPVNTHSAHEAIGGKDGAEIVDDYRGVPVLSAYAPVDIDGVNWGILAEIDEAEAFASLSALKKITFIIALIIAGIVAVVGVLVARSIARPISRIIDEMSEGSSQVASASVQLAGSSQSLSEGASEQASSLEETSASLEEISSMVKQNAENSTQASQLAIGARTTAEKGSDSVTSMVTAMTEINQSSEEVSKIIKVINEIAFQTNLLALNAAVEAARAGEHGKGFAVVAEEVRNLAKRSAEAAKETGGLIESSVNKAKDGSKLAEEAGVILTEIVTNNKKVEDLVGEITAASKEQSDGLDQVTKALMQMDQVTQAVSANSEETSASSEELSAQSDGLKSMVMNLAQVIGGEKATAGGGDHLTRTRRHNDDDDDNGKYHVEVDAHALGGGKNPNTVRAVTGLEKQKTKTKETLPLDDDFKDF